LYSECADKGNPEIWDMKAESIAKSALRENIESVKQYNAK